jgi:predicted RNase H-like HicB family nuclease
MQEHRYTVQFEPVPEGGYHVTVPALPEIATFGETLDEAREMALDAIRCVLESMIEDNEPIPDDTPAPVHRETLAVTLP